MLYLLLVLRQGLVEDMALALYGKAQRLDEGREETDGDSKRDGDGGRSVGEHELHGRGEVQRGAHAAMG